MKLSRNYLSKVLLIGAVAAASQGAPSAGFAQHIEWCIPTLNIGINVSYLAASKDGTIFVAGVGYGVEIWDAVRGSMIRSYDTRNSDNRTSYVTSIGIADDASNYLFTTFDGRSHLAYCDDIWQPDNQARYSPYGLNYTTVASYYSPSHKHCPGFQDGDVHGRMLYASGTYDFDSKLNIPDASGVDYSPEADLLLISHSGGSKAIEVRRVSSLAVLSQIAGLAGGSLMMSHDGRYACASDSTTCILFEIGSHPTAPTSTTFSLPEREHTLTTFSIDNDLLIVAQDRTVTWYALQDGPTATKVASVDLPSRIRALGAICGPRGTIAYGTADGRLGSLRMNGETHEFTLRHGVPIVKFSRTGSEVYLADTGLQVMDTSKHDIITHYLDGIVIQRLAVNPIRDAVAIQDRNGIAEFDLQTAQVRRLSSSMSSTLQYSPDGNFLLTDVGEYDLRSNSIAQDTMVRAALAFAHHHPLVAAIKNYGIVDNRVVLFDTITRDTTDLYYQIDPRSEIVSCMQFSEDDSILTFAVRQGNYPDGDGHCWVVAAHLGDKVVGELGIIEAPLALWVQPDEQRIKSISTASGITEVNWHFYPTWSPQSCYPLIDTRSATSSADISPDHSHLITCATDGTLRMWCLDCDATGPIQHASVANSSHPGSQQAIVYPNPASGTQSVRMAILHPGYVSVRFVDDLGRCVEERSLGFVPAGSLDIRLAALPRGVYRAEVFEDEAIIARGSVVVQ